MSNLTPQERNITPPGFTFRFSIVETTPGLFYAGHGCENKDRREAMRFKTPQEASEHYLCDAASRSGNNLPLCPHQIQECIIKEKYDGHAAEKGWRMLDDFICDEE